MSVPASVSAGKPSSIATCKLDQCCRLLTCRRPRRLDKDQKWHLESGFAHSWELIPNMARLSVVK